MNYEEILKKILRRYAVKTDQIPAIQRIEAKLARHAATYADAGDYAVQVGRMLTDALREYLPEALTDGKLYRAAAEILVEQPVKRAGRDVADITRRIQQSLNENADIGLNAIVPEMNQDQIDGIITGICNAETFAGSEELFMDQIGNLLEGYVDDFVHDNADFQSEAGLTVYVQRIAAGKCCAWCSRLGGTYLYEDVRDRGNDVWRRHNNCHCQIIFDPQGSKRRGKRR